MRGGAGRSSRRARTKPLLGERIDWEHPLAAGLGACWLFAEGAGSRVLDVTPYRNPASFVDNPVWRPGRGGGSLQFNGSSYLAVADGPFLRSAEGVTVVALVSPDDLSGDLNSRSVLTKGIAPYSFYFTLGGQKLNLFSDDPGGWVTGNATLALNQWQLVAAGRDRAQAKLWLNGRLDQQATYSGTPQWSAVGGRIGSRQIGDYATTQFSGRMEVVYYYRRLLSDAEVLWLQQDLYAPFTGRRERRAAFASSQPMIARYPPPKQYT